MGKTLKEQFIAALEARGERKVKETHKYVVYSRRGTAGYYYVGKAGALRVGHTIGASIPVSDIHKQALLAGAKDALQTHL